MQTHFERTAPVEGGAEQQRTLDFAGGISAARPEIQEGLTSFADIQQRMRGPDTSGLHSLQITSGAWERGNPVESAQLTNVAERPVADRNPFIRFDRRASEQFKEELNSASSTVREQLPESLRELLKPVKFQPVRSINNDASLGGLYEPSKNPHEIVISEKGTRGGLESVLKHELGHAFDYLSSKTPLSDNPQFRKLVDQAIQPGSPLARERRNNRDAFYAEVFGDLFAKNLNAPAQDLSVRGAEKLTAAQEWVRARMYGR
ncbi:MAG TPA: hypothetical protein PKZ32_09165 [Candidatus Melainabacteria bacterium]|nr:hypothetical protein [Candidatus Melainabacteria bacterium]